MALLESLYGALGDFFKGKQKKLANKRRKVSVKRTSKKVVKKSAVKGRPSKVAKPAQKKTTSKKVAKKKVTPKKKEEVSKTAKLGAKKTVVKKKPSIKKKSVSRIQPAKKDILVGEITHYFSKIKVCVVKVTVHRVRIGDQIRIKGKKSDFKMEIKSLQVESLDVQAARAGQLVGLKVSKIPHIGDKVFKIS